MRDPAAVLKHMQGASRAGVQAAFSPASRFALVCVPCSSAHLPIHLSVPFWCADPIWKQLISCGVWAPFIHPSRAQCPGGLGCFQADPHFSWWEWEWGTQ